MVEIPRLSEFVYVMMRIEPLSELNLPADPSIFQVRMCFSQTRHLGDSVPTLYPAMWFTNEIADPPKHYAGAPIGSQTDPETNGPGVLDRGVWYPFAHVVTNPEIPLLAGAPFRIT